MKVLVISHSAIQTTYQKKFDELSKYPDIELRVLVPKVWIENSLLLTMKPLSKDRLSYHSGRIIFPGYGSRFFFVDCIVQHFRDFRPDIIHLEEEPWSLCALQTIILRRLFCPHSKLVFRTSLSVPIKLKLSHVASQIEKLTFMESDHAFVLSQRAGKILREKGYKKPFSISPNGVDPNIFRKMDVRKLKTELGIKDEFVFGYVGRLLKMKGIDVLIRGFHLLTRELSETQGPNIKLLLVGSGDYKQEAIEIASELGIRDKLIIVDAVPALKVPEYLNCMDVLVLPSVTTPGWVEFFGRVLVEAMMCEVPVIGSSSGEIPNVIADAGLVFKEADPYDLKDKMKMMLSNPYLRDELIKKGKSRASSLYVWEAIAKDTYDVYNRLMEN